MSPNIQRNFFWLNVRTKPSRPSICVPTFRSFTIKCSLPVSTLTHLLQQVLHITRDVIVVDELVSTLTHLLQQVLPSHSDAGELRDTVSTLIHLLQQVLLVLLRCYVACRLV